MNRTLQFVRTDRDIMQALLRLMDRMDFDKITIHDIVEEAMINRSTFYLHFHDKYEVLERVEGELIRQLADLLEELKKNQNGLNIMDRLLQEYFIRQRDVLRRLIRTENFEQQISNLVKQYLQQMMPDLPTSELEMFNSLVVSYILYIMEHPEAEGSFSTMFMENFLDIAVRFFQLDRLPDGHQRLLDLVVEANRKESQ